MRKNQVEFFKPSSESALFTSIAWSDSFPFPIVEKVNKLLIIETSMEEQSKEIEPCLKK